MKSQELATPAEDGGEYLPSSSKMKMGMNYIGQATYKIQLHHEGTKQVAATVQLTVAKNMGMKEATAIPDLPVHTALIRKRQFPRERLYETCLGRILKGVTAEVNRRPLS